MQIGKPFDDCYICERDYQRCVIEITEKWLSRSNPADYSLNLSSESVPSSTQNMGATMQTEKEKNA